MLKLPNLTEFTHSSAPLVSSSVSNDNMILRCVAHPQILKHKGRNR